MTDMTHEEAEKLTMLCNGCGQSMRFMGEWPVSYPKPEQPITMNVQQSYRWTCRTCKTPHEKYEKGLPVMVALIGVI